MLRKLGVILEKIFLQSLCEELNYVSGIVT